MRGPGRAVVLLAALAVLGCGGGGRTAPLPDPPAASKPSSAPPAASAPTADATPAPCEPVKLALPELIETKIDVAIPAIEDANGHALTPFYDKLAALARGQRKEPLRIVVYGDSNLTEDLFTGEMRRVLQQRHGDAGHGYVAIGKPWTWYRHQDVQHGLNPRTWKSYAVSTDPVLDQCYGFGGIAAQTRAGGARAWVETAKAGAPVGRRASRADVFYLMQPKGGSFEVLVDGEQVATLDTAAPELATGFRRFELSDGPHRIKFVADLLVRIFGVALEREGPGVVIDSIGVGGANERMLARMNPKIMREALDHRPHDLVIFLTGATEDANEKHIAALTKRIRFMREVLPEASLLVMSPPDFAYGSMKLPRPSGRIVRLGRQKRAVAKQTGCAFWDFHGAMGGKLSIARFALLGMAMYDLAHLNDRGAAYMARRFLHALLTDFNQRQRAGCPGEANR